ncbi:MAG: ATP synthase F0 subunit B [Deltaproteobacteria bacterium]|nr:ATP synthase F0 subunit B [Deltaproteobacteria bacterium]
MIDVEFLTVVVQAASFVLLVLVLNFVMFKPILKFVAQREQHLLDAQSEVDELRRQAEQKVADYEKALARAKSLAVEERNRLVEVGSEEAKRLLDKERSEIPALLEQFQRRLTSELDLARGVLQNHSAKLAEEIATKVLGRSV